ncbi:MAG TPA: PilW family protein [Tahibacter sp.]|jgi:type IV pilus assembly protein PilW|nr:PilW family protein [Tahibacter sp.]
MNQLWGISGRAPHGARKSLGFSLIELMVAMTLGLLVSAGIVTAFSAVSRSSKVQNGLSRVQENGRYAVTRLESDLRMYGALFRSSNSGGGYKSNTGDAAVGAAYPRTSIMLNTTRAFVPPDSGGASNPVMLGWPSNVYAPISARFAGQGYKCTASSCTPTVPTGTLGLPAAGVAAEQRVPGADVLTIRYQRGSGWRYIPSAAGVVPPTLTLQTTDPNVDPLNFQSGDFAMISDCNGSQIVAVNVTGSVLTVVDLKNAQFYDPSPQGVDCDARVFNATRDWNTVTYWLKLIDDPNPQAPASRLIPVLMRNDNGVSEELVQGVERLDFLYSVADATGDIRFLNAAEVTAQSNAAGCPMPSLDFQAQTDADPTWREPGCLWRAIRGIEVHLLLNTIDDQFDLAAADTAYRYSIDTGTTPAAPTGTTMPVTGLPTGRMLRREFLTFAAVRNGNY